MKHLEFKRFANKIYSAFHRIIIDVMSAGEALALRVNSRSMARKLKSFVANLLPHTTTQDVSY